MNNHEQQASSGQNDLIRDRAKSLFGFLRSVCQVRTKTVYDLDRYERVFWLEDVPDKPGCYSASKHIGEELPDEEVWVSIKKPKLQSHPKPDIELAPWLYPEELSNSSLDMPNLRDQIIIAPPESPDSDDEEPDELEFTEIETRELKDHPHIRVLFDKYVETKWWDWKEYDLDVRPIQQAYENLFYIYQRQQATGEQFEIVLGLGLLEWSAGNRDIYRHIFSCQAVVKFDARKGELTVGPAQDGARTKFEEEIIPANARPDVNFLENLNSQLQDAGDDIWNEPNVRSAVEQLANEISGSSIFLPSVDRPKRDLRQDPRISFSPALILRRRTERALIQMFEQILLELRAEGVVPPAVSRYLSVGNETRDAETPEGIGNNNVRGFPGPPEEIYFPLEANSEQRKIVENLQSSDGVLVQGPPGTGKSHTIVNLICHLLATGQRVLVTSQAPRALEVLRHFIKTHVPAIAPLAVVQLGADHASLEAMEHSVMGITGRQNEWDVDKETRRIEKLQQSLDNLRREKANILQKLVDLREGESYSYNDVYGRYSGTRSEIAKQIAQEVDKYSWFVDALPEHDSTNITQIKAPLEIYETSELLELLRDPNLKDSNALLDDPIDISSLPTVQAISDLFEQENQQIEKAETYKVGFKHPTYSKLARLSEEELQSYSQKVEQLEVSFQDIATHINSWTEECVSDILADRDRRWQTLLDKTMEEVNNAAAILEEIGNMHVVGLREGEELHTASADATKLIAHIKSGKNLGGLFRNRLVKETEYIHKDIRCDGQNLNNVETLEKFIKWIRLRIHLKDLETRWKSLGGVKSDAADQQLDEYRDFCEPLEQSVELLGLKRTIQADCKEFDLSEPNWHEPRSLSDLFTATRSAIANHNLERVREQFQNISRDLDDRSLSGAGSFKNRLRESIDKRDIGKVLTVWEEIQKENIKRSRQQKKSTLANKLEQALPLLAKELYRTLDDDSWVEKLQGLQDAWNHKWGVDWLVKTTQPGIEIQLRQNLADIDIDERRDLGEIASLKAWQYCFERMTDGQRQNLIAWKNATKRIGKGTGKYASRHRQAAKTHMEGCRNAIPAWVLPIHRVAEFMRPGKDMFDVVIVDEASQSGLEALFLTYIAKKVIVVGDDKQISPTSYANQDEMDQLRRQHIPDLPHSEEYNVNTSFFDMTEIRYRGRIRLREHFRCMPEIIQFSNKLCYEGEPLIPLKQYGVDRLEPVIETIFVSDGYMKEDKGRHRANLPEAEAVVEKIVSLCSDPRYDGKTFGVISLLGSAQANIIEGRLVTRLRSKDIEERRIVCGDAYSFQGDERDVMFLSMVVAHPGPNQQIGALTRLTDQRRFNVAASRAKDQLFLFHSLDLSILNKSCMRYKLLEYCKNPTVEQSQIEGVSIDEIRYRAKEFDRQIEKPPQPFDSWFEVDVFLDIANRGYRVIPQYSIAGKYIDLLVQGMKGSLAVECDGDAFHGIDEYEDDLKRQQQLERVGLTFFRIRESSYHFDKSRSLDKLWRLLEKHQIFPGGMEKPPTTQAEQRSEQITDSSLGRSDEGRSESIEESDATGGTKKNQPTEKLELSGDPDERDLFGYPRSKKHSVDRKDSAYIVCNARKAVDDPSLIDPTQFSERSYSIILIPMAEYVVKNEGPIIESLLATRIARAHNFRKTGQRIKDRITRLTRNRFVTTKDVITGSVYYWPKNISPDDWNIFRLPAGEDDIRSVENICLVELAVLIQQIIEEDVGDPAKEIASMMQLRRLRQSARQHLESAYKIVMSQKPLYQKMS